MKNKIELWKEILGVKIYKHVSYYEDFISINDNSLLGRLFNLKDFISIGIKEFIHYSLRYKLKDGKIKISIISGLMLECAKNPIELLKFECKQLKKGI